MKAWSIVKEVLTHSFIHFHIHLWFIFHYGLSCASSMPGYSARQLYTLWFPPDLFLPLLCVLCFHLSEESLNFLIYISIRYGPEMIPVFFKFWYSELLIRICHHDMIWKFQWHLGGTSVYIWVVMVWGDAHCTLVCRWGGTLPSGYRQYQHLLLQWT